MDIVLSGTVHSISRYTTTVTLIATIQMKLSKHKLPKISNKVVRTAKHKDSAVKKSRVEEKSNKMAVDTAPIPVVSDEAKEQAKQLRKIACHTKRITTT